VATIGGIDKPLPPCETIEERLRDVHNAFRYAIVANGEMPRSISKSEYRKKSKSERRLASGA
jgi:hypothetical protein